MKLTIAILLTAILQSSAAGYAQMLSISLKNATLEEVLTDVKKQTGYNFLYTVEVIGKASKISIHVKNKPLTEVLNKCFANQPLVYTLEERTVIIKERSQLSLPAPTKAVVVKGSIVDDKGEPLVGVTIRLKGGKAATTSDINGAFSINIPDENGILIFTYIAFVTQEIEVKGRTTINVKLLPQEGALNEVVVVGYGQQKKITMVNAVSSITTKDLKQSPTANVTNALAGRLPGLIAVQGNGEPGLDHSALYIRGINTYNSNSQQAIVIVDGLERSFNYLNPEEIESISILKDASATAVFGIRGANGVIVVTTKRGESKAKPNVTFKAQAGLADAVKYPAYLGSYEYAQLYNEASLNDNPNISPASLFSAAQIENFKTAVGDNSDGKGYNINYYDYAFKPTLQSDYTLTINGGNESARYFVLGSFLNQDNNYRHVDLDDYKVTDGFKKYNFRSNVDVNINKNLTARLDLSARVQNRITPASSGGNPATFIINLVNTIPPMYPITIAPNGNAANSGFFTEHDNELLFGNTIYRNNILGELNRTGYINEYSTYLEGTFRLAHKLDFIAKGMRAEAFVAYDSYAGNRIDRKLPTTVEGGKTFPGYATFSPTAGINEYWNGGNYPGSFMPTRSAIDATIGNTIDPALPAPPNRRITGQFTLNYDQSFGYHTISALFLANRSLQTRSNEVPFARQGLSSRVTYNWKQKYLAEFNLGYNGSENFAPGYRYGFFPAAAVGWVVSEEKFMKNVQAINLLKLRVSHGLAGSDIMPNGSPRFGYVQLYTSSGSYQFGNDYAGTTPAGITEGALNNPLITWEKSRETNLGLDLELFNSKLGITADVFHKYRYDVITAASSGATNGFTEIIGQAVPPINLGKMRNTGIDLELRYRNKIGQVSYFIRPNFTFTQNKVIFMNEVPRPYEWMRREGRSLNTNFVYVVDGFFQSPAEINGPRPQQQWGTVIPGDIRYKDIDGNGVIQQDLDQIAMGYPRVPQIQYGIPLGLSWKGIDFSVMLQGAARSSLMVNGPAAYPFPSFDFDKIGGVKTMHLDRWTPTNPNASFPALHIGTHPNNQQASDLYLYDTSYLRLKTAEVGYNLSKSLLKKIKIANARIYLQGLNLKTWDKLDNIDIDPETGNLSTDGAWYPIQKIYNLGIEITL